MNQFWTQRWPIALAMLATLLLGLSGCGAQSTSWTGLTIAGEKLYAADLTQVVALNTSDGQLMWAYPKDPKTDRRGYFYATPAVDETHVIVASQVPATGFLGRARNVVWALDPETGAELWSFDEAGGQYLEGGAIGGSFFVIGNSDGNVYALDVESGALRWTFPTGHRVWAAPLIASDTVYIGSMDRHLYALNLSNGEVRWSFQAKGAFAGAPALWQDTLYIGAFDDQFYAIDAQAGTERWRFPGENWFWSSPVVYSDTVYAVDVNGNVYAADAGTGEQVWHKALEADKQDVQVRGGPALSEDGSQLFVGGQNGILYALDTADGFEMWSQGGEGQILATPVVSGSVVYELLSGGTYRIRARHVDNGREIWAYPPAAEK